MLKVDRVTVALVWLRAKLDIRITKKIKYNQKISLSLWIFIISLDDIMKIQVSSTLHYTSIEKEASAVIKVVKARIQWNPLRKQKL